MPWSVLDRGGYDGTVDTYRVILEGAPTMLWLGDASGKCVYLNHMQREFWGVRSEEIPDFSWSCTLHPDDVEELSRIFGAAMDSQEAFEVEARYKRADGNFRILHTQANPRFGPSGEFLGMVGVNVDVTSERASERRVALLSNELAHRNRNLFSVVTGIASITERERPEAAEAFKLLRTRLRALSIAHEETKDLAASPTPRHLHELVNMILAPYQAERIQCTVAGLDFRLSQNASASLALILQELATNSAKYGCLSGEGSLVFLTEEADGADILISWIEDTVSDVPVQKNGTGFGSSLLTAMAEDLGASISTDHANGSFVVRLKVSRDILILDPAAHTSASNSLTIPAV